MWRDFKQFLVKENILALAIAVVLGAAMGKLVTALVNDFIMPIIRRSRRRRLAPVLARRRASAISHRRFPRRAPRFPHHRLRRLADQQGVHSPGGSRRKARDARMPVLPLDDRRPRHPLRTLHGNFRAGGVSRPRIEGWRKLVRRSRTDFLNPRSSVPFSGNTADTPADIPPARRTARIRASRRTAAPDTRRCRSPTFPASLIGDNGWLQRSTLFDPITLD